MIEQRTKEWYAQRVGKITGSAVGAILGLSPFMSTADVMRRMVREAYGAESEFQGNVATEYGTFHEAGAKTDYELETGNAVNDCSFYISEQYPWIGASPDGFIGEDGLIEIKCPYSLRDKLDPQFKSINDQPHYHAQIQLQLFVTGRKWCDFYQWAASGTKTERVYFDAEYIKNILPQLVGFYNEYLAIVSDKDLSQIYLEPPIKELSGAKYQMLLDEYDELTDAVERASERKKEILAELIQSTGEQNAIINGIKLQQIERKGSVNYSKVVKEHCPSVDLEGYRGKSTTYWKLG
jgi:putative phage-type endonuclease